MTTATIRGSGQATPPTATAEHSALIALAASPSAVPMARGLVRRAARHWNLPDAVIHALALITSELVTNVLVHSGSPDAELLLTVSPEQAELRVKDHGQWHAPSQHPGSLPTGGRGLGLVRAHAELDLAPGPSGTVATARIPLNPPGTQAP